MNLCGPFSIKPQWPSTMREDSLVTVAGTGCQVCSKQIPGGGGGGGGRTVLVTWRRVSDATKDFTAAPGDGCHLSIGRVQEEDFPPTPPLAGSFTCSGSRFEGAQSVVQEKELAGHSRLCSGGKQRVDARSRSFTFTPGSPPTGWHHLCSRRVSLSYTFLETLS
jgi:hypothetical protein|uniref:Uncharacterized protein n=1 Tax=Mus musculus TaxID=10090 RepID=Q8CDH0_MOUSE|nr:unnamed protein product [Mus musculus]